MDVIVIVVILTVYALLITWVAVRQALVKRYDDERYHYLSETKNQQIEEIQQVLDRVLAENDTLRREVDNHVSSLNMLLRDRP